MTRPRSIVGLHAKSGPRVAAEQAVLAVVENAKASLWTLEQLRHGLRERLRLFRKEWPEAKGGVWYAAIVTIYGVRVTKITDPRQVPIRDWRGAR
jgi:hypothetical protein